MRGWRLIALLLAVAAFGLAAAGSGQVGLRFLARAISGGDRIFFWVGVGFFLLAVWRKGGT